MTCSVSGCPFTKAVQTGRSDLGTRPGAAPTGPDLDMELGGLAKPFLP